MCFIKYFSLCEIYFNGKSSLVIKYTEDFGEWVGEYVADENCESEDTNLLEFCMPIIRFPVAESNVPILSQEDIVLRLVTTSDSQPWNF